MKATKLFVLATALAVGTLTATLSHTLHAQPSHAVTPAPQQPSFQVVPPPVCAPDDPGCPIDLSKN